MKLNHLAWRGLLGTLVFSLSVAPAWSDTLSEATDTVGNAVKQSQEFVQPAVSAVEETVAPVTSQVNEAVKPVTSQVEKVTKPVTSSAEEAVKPLASKTEEMAKPTTTENEGAGANGNAPASANGNAPAGANGNAPASANGNATASANGNAPASAKADVANTSGATLNGEAVNIPVTSGNVASGAGSGAKAPEGTTIKADPTTEANAFSADNYAEEAAFCNTFTDEDLSVPTIGVPTEGQVYQELFADLNHDEHTERVTLIPFATEDTGDIFMNLVVFNDQNEILWQTPKVTDCENVKTFALTNAGDYDLQLLYDIDGDGNIELLVGLPRSDVRPKPYRLWRWDGDKFNYVQDLTFQADPNNNELFLFDEKNEGDTDNVAWLEGIAIRRGELKAKVCCWKSYGMGQGFAILRPSFGDGLRVVRWDKHILDMQY